MDDRAQVERIVSRSLWLRTGGDIGTAFAANRAGKQYVVTAGHVVRSPVERPWVDLNSSNGWRSVRLCPVFRSDHVDVAVFACDTELSPSLSLPLTSDGLGSGQAVYFSGAPSGPELAACRRRVFSTATVEAIKKDLAGESVLLLEGYAKPGSSGAPVVWRDSRTGVLGICGVLTGAWAAPPAPATGRPMGGFGRGIIPVRAPAFIKCVDIAHVVEAIEENPNGLPVVAPEP